jgi:hypothetical protein
MQEEFNSCPTLINDEQLGYNTVAINMIIIAIVMDGLSFLTSNNISPGSGGLLF